MRMAQTKHAWVTVKDRETYQEFYEYISEFVDNTHVTAEWDRTFWLLPHISGEVLEVGCGWGGVTKILAVMPGVTRLHAIDITDENVRRTREALEEMKLHIPMILEDIEADRHNTTYFLKSKVSVEKSYIEDLDSPEEYDTVVLMEVLEHVLDPQVVLKAAWATLKPGGKLVISVPGPVPEWKVGGEHLRQYTLAKFYDEISQVNPKSYFHMIIPRDKGKGEDNDKESVPAFGILSVVFKGAKSEHDTKADP
jgi:2-polyprenyl-3-methyl-5-hydroxy-6-metoxy-1,4-benzoquinol methylase